MDFENAKAQMRKGVLEFCILSILSKGDAYATDILNKLKESQLIVVEGTLVSFAFTTEKFRFAKLPLGRINPGAPAQILCPYRKRQ